jgi:nuclear pore complex protein Nup205
VEAAKKEIVAASDEGALVSLRCVLATGAFRDENEFSRRAYLDLSLKILRSAMRAALHDADLGDALAAVTPAMTAEQIAREERHAASADDFANRANRAQDNAFDAYGVPAYGHDGPVGNDDNDVHFSEGERLRAMREDEDSVREAPLVALCRALAEAYRQSPESARRDVSENLAERPNRGDSSETRSNQPPLRVFLDAICEWEHGVESLAAALEVLAALAASGDAGARDVWERLRAPPEGAAAAWDHFLGAVAGYNRRFAFGDVEDETVTGDAPYRAATARGAFGGSTDGGLDARAVSSDREMPEADVQGMVAYLDVLTRCLGGGDGDEPRSSSRVSASGAEARDRVAWLSQRCGGSFLDALMRLHANPVPSRLKAALLKCAGAAAGDSAAGAAEAWARMEAAAILQTRANLSLSSSSGAFAFDDAAGYDGGARAHDRFHEQRDGRGGYGRGGVDFDDQAFRAFADGGYGAAAAARQRWLHERRAFEGAERSAAARDQLAVPGADLAYELAYSEARARTYPHASSYVRLVNKLMRACEGGRVGPCADAGRASFAQFAFVRDRVFGELRRRRHNSQEERWWLARDALEHFRIQLRVWRDAVRSGDEDASLAAVDGGRFAEEEALHERSPRRDTRGRSVDGWNASTERLARDLNARDSNRVGGIPPGLEIMTDFMSDGPLFRGVVAVLSLGAERLAAERAAAHGAALEASTAEALALLNDAMALDVATLDATRSSLSSDETASGTERESLRGVSDVSVQTRNADRADAVALRRAVAMRAETVDRSLLRDPSACACVLGFCRYRFDPRVPLRAIQILAVLSERNERLLDLLPPNAVDALAEGAAGVLELASSRAASETSRSTEDENNSSNALDGDPEDAVAAAGAAVLDVILDALPRRAPNVAHALLGLNASPFGDKFTCLTVLLELLEATPPSLCCGDADVAPPEAAARVLFELVADERTAPMALEAVTNWPPGAPGGQQRLALLAADALAATPPSDHTRRAAAAHHRAWLLRVAAAALDFCAPKSSWPVETLDDLPPLAAALARAATRGGDAGFENHPGSAFFENGSSFAVEKPRLAALETLATIPPPPLPPLAAADAALHAFGFLSDETRAARAGLGVDALLSDRRTITEGGCFEVTSRGDAVVSVAALGTRLLENSRRMFETTRLVSSRDAHKLAVQSAVRQARAFNASAEEHAAHAHVAGAWAEFVALVASRCTPARGQSVVEHDPDASEHGGGVDVLFALAEGVLARLAQTPIPRVSSGTGALNSGNFSAFVGDGGGDAWWRALDLPLARLAATLLGELRDGVETKRFLSDEEEEEEEDTESGFSSRAAVAASNATDAAVGGGSPGAGVVDAAAFALSVSPFARGGGGARGQSLSTPDPSRCKALLRGVLGALRRGEARLGTAEGSLGGSSGSSGGKSVALDVDARACAYESLLAFLQYARPKRAAGRFPRSVARLAEGLVGDADGADVRQTADVREGDDAPPNNGSNGSNTSVNVSRETRDARVAARRAARAQDELEAGVGALLRRDAVALADVVGRDIVDPAVDDATRAAALAVAEALLTAVAASGSAAGERAAEHSLRASGFAFGDEETSGEGLPTFPNFAFADENRAPPGGDLSRLPRVAGGNSAAAAGLTPTRSIAPPLVADPATSALARALARAGVIRHCLAAVQSANLSDVILPTAAAAARLAATRAALGVLLRLAQLPGGAKALCESGAMAALAACRAVDAYAHDSPGDAAAAAAAAAARARAEARCAEGGGGAQRRRLGYGDDVNDVFMDGDFSERRRSLDDVDPAAAASVAAASPLARVPLARARHHALLVPVLRLAGTLLNASPDQETRVAAVSFCRAHAAVLHRVLADRSKRAHMCDVAELEAAVALVARLVSFDTSTQETTLNEFVPALDSLTAQIACGDSKYDRFVAAASDARTRPLLKTSHGEVAKRVAESAAGGHALAVGGLSAPVAAAAAAKIEKALRAIRATLVSAQLSLAERGAAVFAFTERPGDGARASPRPTLSSFARLAHRCAEEMREELKARRVELRRLARDGGVAAAAAAFADARGAGGAASAEAAAAFEALAGEGDEELRGASVREAFAGAQGSALGGVADPTTIASLAAAAVGAHERGIRALAVTAEAAIELVLSGGFKGGNAHRFGDDDLGFDDGRGVSNETLTSLAEMFAPAVRALAELDASESAAESAFFGGVLENRPGFETGFAGGVCLDGGRLRALVRRARDALAAAAPPRETAHAPLLAGIEPGTSFEPKRFGGGAVHGAREFW